MPSIHARLINPRDPLVRPREFHNLNEMVRKLGMCGGVCAWRKSLVETNRWVCKNAVLSVVPMFVGTPGIGGRGDLPFEDSKKLAQNTYKTGKSAFQRQAKNRDRKVARRKRGLFTILVWSKIR